MCNILNRTLTYSWAIDGLTMARNGVLVGGGRGRSKNQHKDFTVTKLLEQKTGIEPMGSLKAPSLLLSWC